MSKKNNRRSQSSKPSTPSTGSGRRSVERASNVVTSEVATPNVVADAPIGSSATQAGRPPRASARVTAAQARQEATTAQLEQEYGYVGKDLRRVFVLAMAMFALLIVLNLVLR